MGCFNGSLYLFPFACSMGKKWTLAALLIKLSWIIELYQSGIDRYEKGFAVFFFILIFQINFILLEDGNVWMITFRSNKYGNNWIPILLVFINFIVKVIQRIGNFSYRSLPIPKYCKLLCIKRCCCVGWAAPIYRLYSYEFFFMLYFLTHN